MDATTLPAAETIQRLTAKILATHPAGHRLCLIGGFRYRLLRDILGKAQELLS